MTGEYPAQRAINVKNVSILWRHHDTADTRTLIASVHCSIRRFYLIAIHPFRLLCLETKIFRLIAHGGRGRDNIAAFAYDIGWDKWLPVYLINSSGWSDLKIMPAWKADQRIRFLLKRIISSTQNLHQPNIGLAWLMVSWQKHLCQRKAVSSVNNIVVEQQASNTLRLDYSDVIIGPITSQITSVTGLCEGNSLVTGEFFPAQRASNAENVSIWGRLRALPNMPNVLGAVATYAGIGL